MANSDSFEEVINGFTSATDLEQWAELYNLSTNTFVVDRISQMRELETICKFDNVAKLREWAILNNCLHKCHVLDRMKHLETNVKDIGLKVGISIHYYDRMV